MKTQITYKKLDGSDGVTLITGDASSIPQAKQELAVKLDLPKTAASNDDIDARLRQGGIDPASVRHTHISE